MEPSTEKKSKHGKREKKSHSHKQRDTAASSSTPASTAKPEGVSEVEDWDANRVRVEALCSEYPNNVCNDCNENGTRWAVVNFGIFVCIRCAGVHRSLGTHISKVKSTNMDKWAASEVDLMAAVGNTLGKTLYESQLSTSSSTAAQPLSGGEPDDVVKKFITRKYVDWEFATDKAPKLLRRLQKQVGYGVTKPATGAAGAGGGAALSSAEGTAAQATAARPSMETRAQQQRMMQGLYGQDPLPGARKSAAAAEATEAGTSSSSSRKGRTSSQAVHGSFGVVNVASEDYEARLHALLTAFGCAPAMTTMSRVATSATEAAPIAQEDVASVPIESSA